MTLGLHDAAAGHHRRLTGMILYCLVLQECEQLVQGSNATAQWPGVELPQHAQTAKKTLRER